MAEAEAAAAAATTASFPAAPNEIPSSGESSPPTNRNDRGAGSGGGGGGGGESDEAETALNGSPSSASPDINDHGDDGSEAEASVNESPDTNDHGGDELALDESSSSEGDESEEAEAGQNESPSSPSLDLNDHRAVESEAESSQDESPDTNDHEGEEAAAWALAMNERLCTPPNGIHHGGGGGDEIQAVEVSNESPSNPFVDSNGHGGKGVDEPAAARNESASRPPRPPIDRYEFGTGGGGGEDELPSKGPRREQACVMQKFRLYETQSKFYMIGRDKSRTYWRVLKIDRDPLELNIREDSTTYTERECSDLLRRIHEGNKSTGGLKFVTICYGIVGFIKFLGPYYMLLITKRRQIGAICGHNVYAVSKSEMIPLPNSSVCSNIANSKNENRYKKLLCTVDLTKDFFFSYSYHVMRSLQRNLCDDQSGHVLYETMFVWNEFLTRGIRNHLQNTLWTVALVYGFFKQVTLSISGRDFKLTLIARRSRHYAGTRYLKRGVNEKGRVANDVETEQIVFEDVPEGFPMQISSVVQNRGSIPLFWSQETSRLNLKPDIILSKKDQNYEATRLHFENLVKRYGNPIIILNLIKTQEKKPRESILRAEFGNAIDLINKDLSEENRLRFLHWDLHKHSRSKATNVLLLLGKVATNALTLTDFFYYQVTPASRPEGFLSWPFPENVQNGNISLNYKCNIDDEDIDSLQRRPHGDGTVANGNHSIKPPRFQKGVLRTNCIDCLDRTNVAQYAYGLAALGHQLHALGVIDNPKIDLDAPLADELMGFYERMGDTLAHQYGGSAAHNKIFSERRGQWKAATQSQEFFRTLQRYYSNAYMDAEKQDAINVFLGHFQPQQGRPALWELDSDQHYNVGRNGQTSVDEDARSTFRRSFSDGNILRDSGSPMSAAKVKHLKFSKLVLPDKLQEESSILSESSPEISTCESDVAFSRYTPSMPCRQLFGNVQRDRYLESDHIYFSEHGDMFNCSNFVDLDWLSSSGNSCEEEPFERSSVLTNSSIAGLSSENVVNGIISESTPSTSECGSSKGRQQTGTELSYGNSQNSNVIEEFSDSFIHWVNHGETLRH